MVIIGGDYYRVKDIMGDSLIENARSRTRVPVRDTKIEFTDYGLSASVRGAVTLMVKKFLESDFDHLLGKNLIGS